MENFENGGAFSQQQIIEETSSFFRKVYGWMFLGLIVSGVTAYYISVKPEYYKIILFNKWVFYSLLISHFFLVVSLVGFIEKISAGLAVFLFFLYCFFTGLTFSVIFLVYTVESIEKIFFISALMFGITSIYGYFTKTDLTHFGQVLIMGLIGLVTASLVNFFMRSQKTDYILSWAGVIIFTGLTAYDTQKIRNANIIGNEGTPEDLKESIIGALTLYLDFVNLFLKLLRLFGKKRR